MLKRLGMTVLLVLALVLGVLGVALIGAHFLLGGQAYRMPSETMLPTIVVGERLITTKASEPGRGDIVAFHPPSGAEDGECGTRRPPDSACPRPTRERLEMSFIQRVVAVGGDRVSVRGGRAVIDGKVQDEPYIRSDRGCPICDLPREVTVPRDHVFVMGDNRGASSDSREWGPVHEDAVVGKVRLRYWPPSSVGTP